MKETDTGSSSPTTSTSTMLLSSLAGLLRFSQEDIAQIATAVAGLIRPPPLSGAELPVCLCNVGCSGSSASC